MQLLVCEQEIRPPTHALIRYSLNKATSCGCVCPCAKASTVSFVDWSVTPEKTRERQKRIMVLPRSSDWSFLICVLFCCPHLGMTSLRFGMETVSQLTSWASTVGTLPLPPSSPLGPCYISSSHQTMPGRGQVSPYATRSSKQVSGV